MRNRCTGFMFGTKVINQWHTDAAPTSPAKKLAVIAIMPEQGMRHAVEILIADQINISGGSVVSSTSIPGMQGKLTHEKAEMALEKADANAVLVIFITGFSKGEKLQGADYHVQHEGTISSYN